MYILTHIKAYRSLFIGILMMACSVALAGFDVDTDRNGIALKGYDPVAYFTPGEPTQGSDSHKTTLNGVTYLFASANNLNRFVSNPVKYLPAYGGYCAYGITLQIKVTGDPVAWKIMDGVLYINSSLDSLATWSKDIPGNILKADKIWPEIRDIDPNKL